MKYIKKIFKEKTSIKQELNKSLENNTPISFSILSKLVGISLYRVKKYCKNHNIDLNNYSNYSLNQKLLKKTKKEQELKNLEKQKKKIKIGNPVDIKIRLNSPIQKKINID